jgi:hypothetical protein
LGERARVNAVNFRDVQLAHAQRAREVPAPPSPGSKLPGYLRPSYGRRGASFLVLVPKGRTRIAREFIPATQRGEALRSLTERYWG